MTLLKCLHVCYSKNTITSVLLEIRYYYYLKYCIKSTTKYLKKDQYLVCPAFVFGKLNVCP